MQNNIILASYRTKNNLSQKEMADIIKCGYSTYKLYENGLLPMKLEELNAFSNYFDISLDYLLGLSEKPETSNFRKSIDYRYLKFCIRFVRKRDRISQKKMAQFFNLSVYTICKYEKKPEAISISYIYLICKKFHISADYLCGKSLKKEVL